MTISMRFYESKSNHHHHLQQVDCKFAQLRFPQLSAPSNGFPYITYIYTYHIKTNDVVLLLKKKTWWRHISVRQRYVLLYQWAQ